MVDAAGVGDVGVGDFGVGDDDAIGPNTAFDAAVGGTGAGDFGVGDDRTFIKSTITGNATLTGNLTYDTRVVESVSKTLVDDRITTVTTVEDDPTEITVIIEQQRQI